MELSKDLVNEFVSSTYDKVDRSKEVTCYATTRIQNNELMIQLDGADRLTPAIFTASAEPGDRVLVMLKGRKALVIGNITNPYITTGTLEANKGIIVNGYLTTNKNRTAYDDWNVTGLTFSAGGIGAYGGTNKKWYIKNTGELYAESAEIYGKVTATSGTIGGCNIENGVLKIASANISSLDVSKIDGLSGVINTSLTGYIYQNGTVGTTPAEGATGFVVSNLGVLTASNAVIYGEIYASSGKIGGLALDSKSIHTLNVDIRNNGDGSVGFSSENFTRTINNIPRDNLRFAIGSKFGVASDGTLYGVNADLSGTLTADSGSAIGPWVIASSDMHNGKTSMTPGTNGTYIGTDGISGETSYGYYRLKPNGVLELHNKAFPVDTVGYIEISTVDGNNTYTTTYGLDYISLFSGSIWMNVWNDTGSSTEDYDPHIVIGKDIYEPHVYVGQDDGWSGLRVIGEDVNGGAANEVGIELYGGSEGASIKIESLKDQAILSNYYNSTWYNLIRNHNNGNISVSASSGALYLGYENTTSIDLLNGKATIDADGNYIVTKSDASAWIQARNASGGNGIWIQAETAGTVTLGSRTAGGTTYNILRRANNSSVITALNDWTFNNAATYNSGIIICNADLTKGTTPSSEVSRYIAFTDKDGFVSSQNDAIGAIYSGVGSTGNAYTLLRTFKNDTSASTYAQMILYYPATGSPYLQLSDGCSLQAGGNVYSTVASGEAQVAARNSTTGNRIILWTSSSSGQCGLYSYDSNNTARDILRRGNNTDEVTAYGPWTFNGGVYSYNASLGAGNPIISDSANNYRVTMISSTSTGVTINAQWGGISYSGRTLSVPTSDIRLKTNIIDCTISALPLINAIRMREFDWVDGRHQYIGMVADELEELDYRLAVGGGYGDNGEMNVKSVDTFYLIGYLIKAIQELSALIPLQN